MGLRVGRVHKLAGHKAAGNLLGQLLGFGDGTAHALGALGEHQLGAVGLQQLAALHAHGIGHHNDGPIAAGGRDRRQANAGVAAGGLNDDRTFLQQALGLGVVDHGLGHTVFRRTGGVKVFQLGQDLGLQALSLFQMGEFQQRGMANQLICGRINLTHDVFLPISPGGFCAHIPRLLFSCSSSFHQTMKPAALSPSGGRMLPINIAGREGAG